MTLTTNGLTGEFVADGLGTAHTLPFQLRKPADLVVEANGVQQVQGTHYAVSGSYPAQQIVPIAPVWADGVTISYYRQTERGQDYEITPGTDLRAESLEDELDRNAMIDQEQDEQLGRAVKVARGETPPAISFAGMVDGQTLGMIDGQIVPVDDDAAAAAIATAAMETTVAARDVAVTASTMAGDIADASRRLLATVSATAMIASMPAVYDLSREFANGEAGDYHIPTKDRLWQDTARTIPVTAIDDPVRCIDSMRGIRDQDMLAINGVPGVYKEVNGVPCVRRATGVGFASRASVTLVKPSFLGVAGSHNGALGRFTFGLRNNSNTRHVIQPTSNVRMGADTDSNLPNADRPWVPYTASPDGSGPSGPALVTTSLLSGDTVDCVIEDSTFRGQLVEQATTWLDGENAPGCYVLIGGTNPTTAFNDAGGDFYGGIWKSGEPVNRAAVVATLQAMCRPQVTEADRVIVVVGDSTNDDIGTDAQSLNEIIGYWVRNRLPASHPGESINYCRWTALADTRLGFENIANPTAANRTFVINMSRAGSQPDYFFAERFERALGWLPKVDDVVWSHGHNMPVGDASILASPKGHLYRAGIYIQAQDAMRRRFPMARHLMMEHWPYGVLGDTRIDGTNAAVRHVAATYGDVQLVDLFTAFDTYTPPRAAVLYAPDLLHPSALGGQVAGDVLGDAYDSFAPVPNPTPPLIDWRTIQYNENLLGNGGFETWTGGVPTGWELYGDAVAVPTSEIRGHSRVAKITGTNGGIRQTINCTALQGDDVALTVDAYVSPESGLECAQLSFTTNGASPLGDGRWSQPPYQSTGAFMTRNHFFPVPSDATLLTVNIKVQGTMYLDHAVLVEGDIPRHYIGPAGPRGPRGLSGVDGLDVPAGTVFPASPALNMRFYRTDRHMQFYWDGTRWLSTQQFTIGTSAVGDATASIVSGFANPFGGISDIWAERVVYSGRIIALGTFTFYLARFDGNASVTLDNGTKNTSALILNEYGRFETALNAVIPAAVEAFQFNADRASGTLRSANANLVYRVIG